LARYLLCQVNADFLWHHRNLTDDENHKSTRLITCTRFDDMAYYLFIFSLALSAIVFGIALVKPTLKNWSNSGIDQHNRRAKLKTRLKKDRYFVVIE